jgi:nitroimidazol reductase NimA-like FMN-containing flavoprotein (pyridoxamine 5'-phosphate oxidase superfamily)
MLGVLPKDQIEDLLKTQVVGRIGCSADGETYIVPISYAYDGKYIYCHTREGRKASMMRSNPKICFEVEDLQNMANWKSVVLQGTFEELVEKKERNFAMQTLLNRYLPIISSVTMHLGEHWPFQPEDTTEIHGIVFRIAISEKSGRFESSQQSPAIPG